MILRKTGKFALAATLAGLALASFVPAAKAQNAFYNPADLVLYFQNPGGTTGSDQTVMLSLGNSAAIRDSATNLMNIANIDSLLSSTFGTNWYDQSTLYMGIAANQGTSTLGTALVNGDPSSTIYVGQARTGLGIIGSAESGGFSIAQGDVSTAAGRINSMNNVLETNGDEAAEAFAIGLSQVDDQNEFIQPGQQGTAFAVFPGGVQFNFGSGSFGSFGAAGSIEGALDLYRIQRRDNIAGQYGFGQGVGNGLFLGSITIDQSGNVSYITEAIPEPSVAGLMAGAVVLAGIARRRRNAVK